MTGKYFRYNNIHKIINPYIGILNPNHNANLTIV